MFEICKIWKYLSKEYLIFKLWINLIKESGWFINNLLDKIENFKCIILIDCDFVFFRS